MNQVTKHTYEPTYYTNASEDEQKEFREWLGGVLRTHYVNVHFRKKDGSIRIMNCTLQEGKTLDYEKKTDRVKTVSEDTCPVYDIDKKEWRSFRYDSITEVRFNLGEGL
jgi:hypothetical protein